MLTRALFLGLCACIAGAAPQAAGSLVAYRSLDTVRSDAADLGFGTSSFTVSAFVRPSGATADRLVNKWASTTEPGWLLDIYEAIGGGSRRRRGRRGTKKACWARTARAGRRSRRVSAWLLLLAAIVTGVAGRRSKE